MQNYMWIGFIGAAIALLFALAQRSKVMKFSEGTEKMVKIASAIRKGANAYLKHQYSTVAKVFVVVFIILIVIALAYFLIDRGVAGFGEQRMELHAHHAALGQQCAVALDAAEHVGGGMAPGEDDGLATERAAFRAANIKDVGCLCQ